MTKAQPNLKFNRMRPPIRRVLALDAGSRCIKLLLAQSEFGHLTVLNQEIIDLEIEGLVAPEEVKAHIAEKLRSFDYPPVALTLPQHLSTSQLVEVPAEREIEVQTLIEEETRKLRGVSESRIIHDYIRAESSPANGQRFWVTLAQEADIRERILQVGVERGELCEITTVANALLAAYREVAPKVNHAVLVHAGAQATVVVVVINGQGSFATSFEMAGDFFTRALARINQIPEGTAEEIKRERNLFEGPDAVPEFWPVVQGWIEELKRQAGEWFNKERQSTGFKWAASGGTFKQPGLFEFCNSKGGLSLEPWPDRPGVDGKTVTGRFVISFGAALQALGHTRQNISLLPEDYRAAWQKRVGRQKIEMASLAVIFLCTLALAIGTWHKLSLINRKEAMYDKLARGQWAVDANNSLTTDLVNEYESLRPIFQAQQSTLDVLQSLALLEQVRSNQPMWFVLLSDQQTYFDHPAAALAPGKPPPTNLTALIERPLPLPSIFSSNPVFPTNRASAKPGLIAEVCIPGDAEDSRNRLRALVNSLKTQPSFEKVDLLSEDLRRNLADPKVILPDRDYVLGLDFAVTDFQQPLPARKNPAGTKPSRNRNRPAAFSMGEGERGGLSR